jgi:hypothetical protein
VRRSCISGAAKSNCHTLALSHLELSGVLTAFMPAAVRFYCMLLTSDLGILAITTNETLSKHLAEIRKWRATPPALRVDALAVTRPQPVIEHIQQQHRAARCGPGRSRGRLA